MTSKTASKRAKSIASLPLDLPMAAFAALAVAFVAFAMPDDLFGQAIAATGLPNILAAAEPPLGAKARAAVILVASVATFLGVWTVLKAIGRKSAKPAKASKPAPVQQAHEGAPRLRRADTHPDAPSRRPLFAGLDLGEPVAADQEEEDFDDLPFELTDALPPLEEEELRDSAVVPEFLAAADEADADLEPEVAPAQAEVEAEPEADDWFEERTDEAPAYASASPAEEEPASIANLMQRLELGLIRREQAVPPQHSQQRSPVDDRLRHALDDLQKLAGRAG
jgi:hypothetical protein